jgi:hypothetical protein
VVQQSICHLKEIRLLALAVACRPGNPTLTT